ncbi:hypothetical protein JTB14_021038 [Gonioctena quinquepunctata]|nr:hypothetical protein JTB14_021038 [Gonioctena quinquepunctata]
MNEINNQQDIIQLLFNFVVNDEAKIKVAYGIFFRDNVDFKRGECKNLRTAFEEKQAGNECYSKRDYKEALKHYNTGIIKCPQEDDEGRKLLSILVANRSVVFYEEQEYEKVLQDSDLVEEIGALPENLKYKIIWRKAKSLEALGDSDLADDAFALAVASLMESISIADDVRSEKLKQIEECMENKASLPHKPRKKVMKIYADIEQFVGGEKYPAAIPNVDFRYEPQLGRYAVARNDIPAGTVIVKEEPYVAQLLVERSLTNCQQCFLSLDRPIPCPQCANVVFCSRQCMQTALDSYHGIECPVYGSLNEYGINKFLVLRILTQKGFSFFNDQKSHLQALLKREGIDDRGLTQKDVYRSDDYDNVLLLFHNETPRGEYDIFVYSATVFLLRALKHTNFFPHQTDQKELHEDELFIAMLMLRHCKMVNFNVHGVNEIKLIGRTMILKNGMTTRFESFPIAIGIYPTLAMFNHSCDPSLVRCNINRTILGRTIRPIRAGDVIYENYGPNYLWEDFDKRQHSLSFDYRFKCKCNACEGKWPVAEEMETVIMVPCKFRSCRNIFTVTKNNLKPGRCSYCRRRLPPGAIAEIAGPIQRNIESAEALYQDGKYEDALKTFIRILELMFAYTTKPDLDIIRVQERVEFCMAHVGNKSIHYYE